MCVTSVASHAEQSWKYLNLDIRHFTTGLSVNACRDHFSVMHTFKEYGCFSEPFCFPWRATFFCTCHPKQHLYVHKFSKMPYHLRSGSLTTENMFSLACQLSWRLVKGVEVNDASIAVKKWHAHLGERRLVLLLIKKEIKANLYFEVCHWNKVSVLALLCC